MLIRAVFSAALLAAIFTVPIAQADVVMEDNFNTDGALLGQNPSVGGVWTISGTSVVNPLTVAGGSLAMANTGQDAFSAFSPGSVAATAGTGIYSGLSINVSAAGAGDYFFHLSDPAGTTTNFYNRVYARSSNAGFQLGIASFSGTGSVITYGTTDLNFNQNYRVVTSWDFVSGLANDVFNVYVNPTNSVQAGNTAYIANYTWTGSPEPTVVSAANFRQGGGAAAPVLVADNLTVATTFAQAARLTAIPEPSSIALASLVSIGMILRRRK